MSVWLRHRVPILNWMMRGLLGAVPHGEAPERSPFKATATTTTTSRDGVAEQPTPAQFY